MHREILYKKRRRRNINNININNRHNILTLDGLYKIPSHELIGSNRNNIPLSITPPVNVNEKFDTNRLAPVNGLHSTPPPGLLKKKKKVQYYYYYYYYFLFIITCTMILYYYSIDNFHHIQLNKSMYLYSDGMCNKYPTLDYLNSRLQNIYNPWGK